MPIKFDKKTEGCLDLGVLNSYFYFCFPGFKNLNPKIDKEKREISLAQFRESFDEERKEVIMISDSLFRQEGDLSKTNEIKQLSPFFDKFHQIEEIFVLPRVGLIRGEKVYVIKVPRSGKIEDYRFFEFIFDKAGLNESSIL